MSPSGLYETYSDFVHRLLGSIGASQREGCLQDPKWRLMGVVTGTGWIFSVIQFLGHHQHIRIVSSLL
jgi:hypothetical protein